MLRLARLSVLACSLRPTGAALLTTRSFALHASQRPVQLLASRPVQERTGGPARLCASAAPLEEQIKETIASGDVVVFSKSYCPFCQKTKALFEKMQVPYTALELDEMDNGAALQDELTKFSGQRTVPNVFIKGTHLGGNDDTQRAAASGKLQEMLK